MNETTKAILDDYNAQIEATGAVMKYFIEKKRKFMEKNNIVDDIDMDKAEIVMNIYNRIYNILAYFNKCNE